MINNEQYGCIFQSIDLDQLNNEIEINSKKDTNEMKMYKKVKHVDFFLQNEIKILNTLNYNHSIFEKDHYSKFLNTFSSFTPVKRSGLGDGSGSGSGSKLNKLSYALFHYNSQHMKFPTLMGHIYSIKSPRLFCLSLINTFKSSLNAFAYLKINDLVHLGMSNEMLTVTDTEEILIGNVGCMQLIKDLYEPDKMAKLIIHSIDELSVKEKEKEKLQIFIYPIEHMLLTFLHMNNLNSISTYNIDIIVSSFIKQNSVLNKVSEAFCKDYQQHCVVVLERYVNMSKALILENILKVWQTWNLFSLSMIYLNIILNIFNEGRCKVGFFYKWMKLLLLNTHPDYNKRKSIEDNIMLFSKLCYNNTMDEFAPVLNDLSK